VPVTPPAVSAARGPSSTVFNATVRYCRIPGVIGKKEPAARSALAAADCPVGQILKPKKKAKKKKRT
jgi:hypothetical protein